MTTPRPAQARARASSSGASTRCCHARAGRCVSTCSDDIDHGLVVVSLDRPLVGVEVDTVIVENRIGYGRGSARADRRRSPAHRARSPTTRRLWTMQERAAGYPLALAEAGIAEDPAWSSSTAPTRECQPERRSPRYWPSIRPADGGLRGPQRDGARRDPGDARRRSRAAARRLRRGERLRTCSSPRRSSSVRSRRGSAGSPPRWRSNVSTALHGPARLIVHESDASTSQRRSRMGITSPVTPILIGVDIGTTRVKALGLGARWRRAHTGRASDAVDARRQPGRDGYRPRSPA